MDSGVSALRQWLWRMSLMPKKAPAKVFSEVHGAYDGFEAAPLFHWAVCSTKLLMPLPGGATRLESTVAPPTA